MRYVDSDLSLEMWVSESETPGGFEWAVVVWGFDGVKDFEVDGQEETFSEASGLAYLKFVDKRAELIEG